MSENNIVHNIDLDKPVTPAMARDAMVECFYEAHCTDTGLDEGDPNVNREYILDVIKKATTDIGEDFENPTKKSLLKTVEKLKEFAKKFRDQSVIQKHAAEMVKIIEKIKE